jgi:hypothetical protein
MPKSNSPASGKVKVPKWGVIDQENNLKVVEDSFDKIEQFEIPCLGWKIVRLTGTVSYTLAK